MSESRAPVHRISPLLSVLNQKQEPEVRTSPERGGVPEVTELRPLTRGRADASPAVTALEPASPDHSPAMRLMRQAALTLPERRRARYRSRLAILVSFLIVAGLPTLLAALYYLFLATNQYVTEVKFALRSVERNQQNDAVGAATGLPRATAGIADSFIVADFVTTRQFVEDVENQVGLRRLLSHPDADFWARLDPVAPAEKLVAHWRSMVNARFELSTGILSVKVRAHTPEDSLHLAQAVLTSAEKLANDLSDRGRQDTLRFAAAELAKSEERLKAARASLAEFRRTEKTFDPLRSAASNADLLAKLRQDLSTQRAEAAALSVSMLPTAPPLATVNNRIKATEEQLRQVEAEGARTGTKAAADTGGLLARYTALDSDQSFAEKNYGAALDSMRSARALADRQQIYLAVYSRPAKAESSQFPDRPTSIGLVAGASTLIWLVGLLLFLGVRDHMR